MRKRRALGCFLVVASSSTFAMAVKNAKRISPAQEQMWKLDASQLNDLKWAIMKVDRGPSLKKNSRFQIEHKNLLKAETNGKSSVLFLLKPNYYVNENGLQTGWARAILCDVACNQGKVSVVNPVISAGITVVRKKSFDDAKALLNALYNDYEVDPEIWKQSARVIRTHMMKKKLEWEPLGVVETSKAKE